MCTTCDVSIVHYGFNVDILIVILIPLVPLAHCHSGIILICVVLLMLFALAVTVYFLIHKTVAVKKGLPVVSQQPDPDTVSENTKIQKNY